MQILYYRLFGPPKKRMDSSDKPLYIVFHIHKCGGLSLSLHLLNHLKYGEYCGLYKTGNPFLENRSAIRTYFSAFTKQEKNRLKVIMGHGVYYGIHTLFDRPYRYVVFLRDPVTRTISNYGYFTQDTLTERKRRKSVMDSRGRIYPFREWLSKRTVMHDYMVRYLYHQLFYRTLTGEITDTHLSLVKKRLETFHQVGVLERPEDHWLFYHNLGIPPLNIHEHKTDKRYIPDIDKGDILPYVRKDRALYAHFLAHPLPHRSLAFRLNLAIMHMKHAYTDAV